VSASSSRDHDTTFWFWLVVALMPAGIYGSVPRSWLTTIVGGSLLVSVTAASWVVVMLSSNDFVILAPALGSFLGLGIAASAVIDPFGSTPSGP